MLDAIRRKFLRCSRFEKRLIITIAITSFLCFVLFICLVSRKNVDKNICLTQECIDASNHILTSIDSDVDPCDDFHQFVCGKLLTTVKDNSINEALEIKYKNALHKILSENVVDESKLSNALRFQRKFYRFCMDKSEIEHDKDHTFINTLQFVFGMTPQSRFIAPKALDLHWTEIMVRARHTGMMFNFFLDVGIIKDYNNSITYLKLGLPPTDVFSKNIWHEINIHHMRAILEKWGPNTTVSMWELRKMIEFARNLNSIIEKAESDMVNVTFEERLMTIGDMKNNHNYLGINWLTLMRNISGLTYLKDSQKILISISNDYLSDLSILLHKTPPRYWTNYIIFLFLHDYYRYLTDFVEDSWKQVLDIQEYPKRKELCFMEALEKFPDVLEVEYITRSVPLKKQNHINEMILNIKQELKYAINSNRWMDSTTKKVLIEHIDKIIKISGWHESVLFNMTESDLDTFASSASNILEMVQELIKFDLNLEFQELGVIKYNFEENPAKKPLMMVNALYLNYENTIILPPPVLFSPLYGLNRPEYLNYGAVGHIIGHELTHMLTKSTLIWKTVKNVSRYDWPATTEDQYKQEVHCLINDYNTFGLNKAIYNRDVILEENIADVTGINLAYTAYEKWLDDNYPEQSLPGVKYTPRQMFWIMASTYLCLDNTLDDTPEEEKQNHIINKYRIISSIKNSPFFTNDFSCSADAKMNPIQKCIIFA